jgi:periplasmic divalent cation tolerance protein
MGLRFLYVTASDETEAERIGRALVESRLAACVNILGGIRSIYRWKGVLHDDAEVVLVAKTTEERVPELVEKVTLLHSYECPCVVSLPILAGHPPFLDWIAAETTSE